MFPGFYRKIKAFVFVLFFPEDEADIVRFREIFQKDISFTNKVSGN